MKKSFLDELQKQAQIQSKLNKSSILPHQLDPFTAFVGNYPWQTIVVLSAVTAFVLNFIHF
jgi:hypothetical protein